MSAGSGSVSVSMKPGTVMLALAVATLIAYVPVLDATFINFDDQYYIFKNPFVPLGLTIRGIRWAMTTGFMANWHPLAWISHMTDVTVFGMNPTGHHVTSVVLHTFSTLLLAQLLIEGAGSTWRSLAVAALFGLHPIHVESVAWVSERKDVLCTLFWILTVIFWMRWVRAKSSVGSYIAAVVFFALALASKPMAVTLPFALVLFDIWPLGRLRIFGIGGVSERKDRAPAEIDIWVSLIEKTPFFVLAFASAFVTYYVQSTGGTTTAIQMPLPYRIANAFVSYARYVGKTVFPIDLAINYPHPISWPPIVVTSAVLGFLAVSFAIVRLGRKWPWLFVGWFFFVGVLVPTIGIIQVGKQAMADRYAYLPTIGLFVMAVWTIAEVFRNRSKKTTTTLAAIGTLVMVVCGALTLKQAGYFKDDITLFRHAVLVTGPNVVANNQLGTALSKANKLGEAEAAFRRALAIEPDDALTHTNLGAVLARQGRYDEAVAEQETALRILPTSGMAHHNLGLVLLQRHEVDRAAEHFEQAIALEPGSSEAHTGLGFARSEQGNHKAAIAELRLAIQISPSASMDARDGLGIALMRAGRREEALEVFSQTLVMDPTRAVAYVNYGSALAELGHMDEAITNLETAAQLDPRNVRIRYILGRAFMSKNRIDEAVAQFREASRLDPNNEEVKRELAMALQLLGK